MVMEITGLMESISKLYVDVDETLIFWPNPDKPYVGEYTVNKDLVDVLHKVLEKNLFFQLLLILIIKINLMVLI